MESSLDLQTLSLLIGLKHVFVFNRSLVMLNSSLLLVLVVFGVVNLRSYRAQARTAKRIGSLVEKRLARQRERESRARDAVVPEAVSAPTA